MDISAEVIALEAVSGTKDQIKVTVRITDTGSAFHFISQKADFSVGDVLTLTVTKIN